MVMSSFLHPLVPPNCYSTGPRGLWSCTSVCLISATLGIVSTCSNTLCHKDLGKVRKKNRHGPLSMWRHLRLPIVRGWRRKHICKEEEVKGRKVHPNPDSHSPGGSWGCSEHWSGGVFNSLNHSHHCAQVVQAQSKCLFLPHPQLLQL